MKNCIGPFKRKTSTFLGRKGKKTLDFKEGKLKIGLEWRESFTEHDPWPVRRISNYNTKEEITEFMVNISVNPSLVRRNY